MAICFARQTVVHAEGGSSAVGLSAYVLRQSMTDEVAGRAYDFRKQGGHDLVHAEVFLPEGAPAAYADAAALWNGATAAELTVDRKTGEVRFKTGAQVAWHMILAVPKELAAGESACLVRQFIEERFGPAGVAVQWVLHEDAVNPHAHLLISTRQLSAAGWGKKAREIVPRVRSKHGLAFVAGDERGELTAAWERFQNTWFREQGIDLRVDPKLVVRDTHVGVARQADSERAALSAEAQAEAAARMRDPAGLLAAAGRMRSVWTGTELARVARRNGLPEEEIDDAVEVALSHPESVALLDAQTGRETGYWTTTGIRAQERDVLARAKRMASERFRPARAVDAATIAARLGLTAEQRAVLMRETEGLTRIGAIQGRAGTGKTRTLSAIREAHERRGHRVIGLGPTNVVARSLAADGFETAMTAHLALIHLQNGRERWHARTVVIVDEAAMLDTDILDRVMRAAARAGARLLLAGDDRQLQSVQRGGLFAPVAALAGSMELRQVRRQKTAWQRAASEAFAAGDIAAAVGAYADHGCLAWAETLEESRAALVAAWAEASARDPGASRFIYASTNQEVRRLNAAARAIRVERGEVEEGFAFSTVRGAVWAAAGDRIQFHDTDRHAGIFNGVLGTIVSCTEEEIAVDTDDGARVSFDPEQFNGWAPGYAGTVYRGQGKTQTEVFALYDHAFAWSPSTSYVALTRQTEQVTLYAPRELAADRAALIRQMGRARRVATSLDFTVHDELPSALRESRAARLAGPETLVAPAAPAAADAAARIMPALGEGLRERAEEAGRNLVLDLARAFTAPVAEARAAAEAAIAAALATGDPGDALKDAQFRSQAWEHAGEWIGTARDAYRENGSPQQAADMERRLGAARNRQDFHAARARAHGAVRDMKEKLDELETARAKVHREFFWRHGNRKTQRKTLEGAREGLLAALRACWKVGDAQESLAELSCLDADAEEMKALRDEACRARQKEQPISDEYGQSDALWAAIRYFDSAMLRSHPDWMAVAAMLNKALQADKTREEADFTVAARLLAAGYVSEASTLHAQQETEARQREEAAVRETAIREHAEQQRLSREEKKSEGWSMSL